MNLLTLDPGTMAGMTDEHFIASVEPLLMTPLERELFKRFAECSLNNDMIAILDASGFNAESLQEWMDAPECPSKDVLDDMIDDALYLKQLLDSGESHSVAESLYKSLLILQGELK